MRRLRQPRSARISTMRKVWKKGHHTLTSRILSISGRNSEDFAYSMIVPRAIQGDTMQMQAVLANVSRSIPTNARTFGWRSWRHTSASRQKSCAKYVSGREAVGAKCAYSMDFCALICPIRNFEFLQRDLPFSVRSEVHVGESTPSGWIARGNVNSFHIER